MARPKHLQCPYCENFLRAPLDINFKAMELTGGICKCGAVYAFDRTGHNLGRVFMEALEFVCRGDIDKSLSLDPEDYDSMDFDYDIHTNMIGLTGKTGKSGKLVFVRLKKN